MDLSKSRNDEVREMKKLKSNPCWSRIPSPGRITSSSWNWIPYVTKFPSWIKLGSQVQVGEVLQIYIGEGKLKLAPP